MAGQEVNMPRALVVSMASVSQLKLTGRTSGSQASLICTLLPRRVCRHTSYGALVSAPEQAALRDDVHY
jgi:hypothetical protein